MSKLAGYTPPSATVMIPGASGPVPLVVYGVGTDVALIMARDYAEHLAPIYAKARAGTLDEQAAYEIVLNMVDQVPGLINMVIFYGLDSDDVADIDAIAKIPGGAKIELLDAILRLTFLSENGGGKAFEVVVQAVRDTMARFPMPSPKL